MHVFQQTSIDEHIQGNKYVQWSTKLEDSSGYFEGFVMVFKGFNVQGSFGCLKDFSGFRQGFMLCIIGVFSVYSWYLGFVV